jgi:hypothetical protein
MSDLPAPSYTEVPVVNRQVIARTGEFRIKLQCQMLHERQQVRKRTHWAG